MKKPQMILFDFGHTLGYESHFDVYAGAEALLKLAVKNPHGCTVEQVVRRNEELYAQLDRDVHPKNVELHHHIFFRTLFEPLGIEFDADLVVLERAFWGTASPTEPMPGAVEIIDWLGEHGYRTGVVSNMSFSGAALSECIKGFLPRSSFEFVLASSDYGWRKPERYIFEAAIEKAGVPAEDIWFVGDNAVADIAGSSAVGMMPIWVKTPVKCYYRDPEHDVPPECEHICISSLLELIPLLEAAE